ncbi:MAG: HAMP domain-containing protein, partial [Desulfuromonadales bacterium]|nr:HAMP domain-containing protein [Desulfuromonadales bacterium]
MLHNLLDRLGLNSIQGRSTSIAFFFILATAVVIGVAGFRLTLGFESKRFHEHFSLLATYLARNVEVGVLLGNEDSLILLSENMLQVSDVQVIEIVDRTGAVIMKRSNSGASSDLASVSAPVVASSSDLGGPPMFGAVDQPEVLGEVLLSYSLVGLDQLKELLARRFIQVSVVLALAPIFLYWLLSRAINAPLLSLLGVAGKVSRGQMDVRAEDSSIKEIGTLSQAINEMLDALEKQRQALHEANATMARQQVLAEVGKFSMTVAHEIKNPLAIIKGSLGILRKEGPVDLKVKRRMMGFVDEEVGRIDKLVEDFLIFARPRPPAFRATLVGALTESLMQRVKLLDSTVIIDAELDADQKQHELQCDHPLLERALLHVVRNALEASQGLTPVMLQIACSGSHLVFHVLDDGPGLDVSTLTAIFEPFYTRKAKGTG